MQIKRQQVSPTSVKLNIVADQAFLDDAKQAILAKFAANAKVPGFRPGKAPANLIEKQIDQTALQAEFVEQAVNQLYVQAAQSEKLRPVAPPQITITKFVPYGTLEFTAEVEAVGDIQLADYKKISLSSKPAPVTAKEVDEVMDSLRQRAATKAEVERAATNGDEVVIDFKGEDAKTSEAIDGAEGKDYPLLLGSQNFIPGFEEALIGLKAGQEKIFTLKFPADYGAKTLQNRQVKFMVTVNKVQELKPAKLDDAFAATVGPFKTLAELKADVKKQLQAEKQREADRQFDNELLEKIAVKSQVAIPKSLIEEEIDRIEEEEKRNVVYRGQTWQEHLEAEGVTAEQHRDNQRPAAELRVKGGVLLGEIANQEAITVTPEELEIRLQLLKGQYPDPAMQAELEKPENRRDIESRMMTEKTLDKLRAYAKKTTKN